jgi:hypothetical protein
MHPSGVQVEIRHGAQRAVVVEVGGGLRCYEKLEHLGDVPGDSPYDQAVAGMLLRLAPHGYRWVAVAPRF